MTGPTAVWWWGVERRFWVLCRIGAPSMRRNNTNPSVSVGLARNQNPNGASPPFCGPCREVE